MPPREGKDLMLAGIDGAPLLTRKTGIGVYTDRLLSGMIAADPNLDVRLYLPLPMRQALHRQEKEKMLAELRQKLPERVTCVPNSFPPKARRWLWRGTDLFPVDEILGGVDLYHATNLVMPPLKRAKGVLTVYDLTFMLFPEYHVKGMQAFASDMRKFVGRADRIIAISEHTKRDIVELLDVPAEKIRVTLLAADEKFRVLDKDAAQHEVLAKYGIDREYILYTGTLEPRKNVPALVRAFHMLKREAKIPHRLVLAGKKGWLYDRIFAEVRELGLEDEVIFTGYVPDDDLPYLYNGADLFAYPSIYEGFGIPPLEAMACGCPVVASNSSSLPEVVGDAGVMVDPHDEAALAEAMGKVLADSALAASLREKGLDRSRLFSWERCARETLEVYCALIEKG